MLSVSSYPGEIVSATKEAVAAKETISAKMARRAAALEFNHLSQDAVYQAKRFLLDSVGCALGGYQQHDVKIALQVIDEIAGRGPATVIGTGKKIDPVSASFANALMIRCMDYNDIYWKQDPSHPSDIFPAALACCERAKSDGRELIVGLVLGHEFEMRFCETAFPGIRERGWHHATLTAFVSPLVAGRSLHLSWEQIQHAVGISAVLDLIKTNDLKPDQVEKVQIRSLARAADILSDPSKYDPHTKETADHSLPYVIAAAIVDRQVTPAQFEMKKIMDPAIRAQLKKVEVVADPEIEKVFPALQRVVVNITTIEGRTFSKQLDYPKGDPRNPLTDAEVEEKFAALADGVLSAGAQKKLIDAIWNLEKVGSVSKLMALMKADVKLEKAVKKPR